MTIKLPLRAAVAIATMTAGLAGASAVAGASTAKKATCASITKSVIKQQGFSQATKAKITKYDYAHPSKNEANAIGTTIDFGKKAIVIGCVSPNDIRQALKAQDRVAAMTSTQYMTYLVAQSAGAMKMTMVGGVMDYVDFGNGKEDGVGSLSKAGSIRLDAWVAGSYDFFTFSQPASATPTKALTKFIAYTQKHF